CSEQFSPMDPKHHSISRFWWEREKLCWTRIRRCSLLNRRRNAMEWNGGTGVSPVRGDPLHSLDVRLSDRDRRGRLGFVGAGPPVGDRGSRCSAGCFRARCIRGLFGNKLLCRYPAYNHKIHSAILRATLIAVVVGDRMIFGVSGCREPLGGESELCNQQSHQFGGAGSRELPIVAELRIVDRFVIGMPFDAHAVVAFGEQPGNPAEGTERGGAHLGRAALEKSDLAQADN